MDSEQAANRPFTDGAYMDAVKGDSMKLVLATALVLAILPLSGLCQEKDQVDPALKAYKKVDGISGNLNSVGSDTLNNLMTLWAEAFKKQYPNVNIQIEGKGSSTAPPALTAGSSQLGPMSREMKGGEISAFEKKYNYKPTQLRVALDALAVYVHKDCPLDELTMEQVDAIFSKSRKRGLKDDITTWDQIGVTGAWAGKPISLYGRNSASGTYGFYKEVALKNGDFKDTVKEQPGSASVVMGVAGDKFAMGYSGCGYIISSVKMLRLAPKAGQPAVPGTKENVYSESYPLWRFLYVYVNRAPGKELSPLLREFSTLLLTKEGQEVVVKDGFYPLPAAVAEAEIGKIR
jgi:phosphate transport system substrate-binding protein